jgi:hypothetical protein
MENFAVGGQRVHTFLNAGTPRVVQTDDRRADLYRQVHHLADLLGVRLSQGSADDGKILAEHENFAAVDGAVAGDHTVAGITALTSQGAAPARLEYIELLEGSLVQKQIDPLPGAEFALAVLGIDFFGVPGGHGFGAQSFKGFKGGTVFSMHGRHLLSNGVSLNCFARSRVIYIPDVAGVHHFEKEPG